MSIPPTDRDLLAAARACYEAGDYGMAIIYAYAYQLMELDQRHAIQLRKGKTNRQYLRKFRTKPRLRELLRDTMLAFEDAVLRTPCAVPGAVSTLLGRTG